VPGIDRLGAAMLLVEIGTDMDSFGSAERLASWVGICPGNNESAGKRKICSLTAYSCSLRTGMRHARIALGPSSGSFTLRSTA